MPCRSVRCPAALRFPLVMCFAAIIGTLAVAPAAYAYLAAPRPDVTVTFLGNGPAPLVCTSRPDSARVTMPPESWLKLVNHTGAQATLWLEESSFPLADGQWQEFKLRVVGSYTVKLIPDCLVTIGSVAPLTVVVEEDRSSPTTPPAAGGPGSTPAAPGPTPADPARQSGGGRSLPATWPPVLPSQDPTGPSGQAGVATPASGVGGGAAKTIAPGTEEEDYESYGPYDTDETGQGFRLLAIIAAVCVFGVSVAIIRVILAQRATKSVGA